MRGLLKLPQVFTQARHGSGRIEDDFRAVQSQRTGPFRKMAVVADIDAHLGEAKIKNRKAQIPRPEIELLPEPGRDVRNVRLAILPEISAVVVNHRRGVVIDAFLLEFVDGNDQRDVMAARLVLH